VPGLLDGHDRETETAAERIRASELRVLAGLEGGHGIDVELDITVALGVPVAEVARQVDSAIRYAVRQAIDREVGRITIHVDGLHVPAGGALPQSPTALPIERVRPRDLADSGTDVA